MSSVQDSHTGLAGWVTAEWRLSRVEYPALPLQPAAGASEDLMRRYLIVLTLLILPATVAAQSQNVTVRDIVELTKGGLGDEALIALIEVNRPVFPVDVETLKGLKDAGVSPAVIVAMIKSGRTPPPPPLPSAVPVEVPPVPQAVEPDAAPPVVVIEHHERVREVPVAVPVYVAVPSHRLHRPSDRPKPKPVEPVYWGWGGKLRPDAWKPAVSDIQKDAKVPPPQRK